MTIFCYVYLCNKYNPSQLPIHFLSANLYRRPYQPQDVVEFYLDWCKKENEHIQALYEHDKENDRDIHNIFASKLAQADDERFVRYVFDIY